MNQAKNQSPVQSSTNSLAQNSPERQDPPFSENADSLAITLEEQVLPFWFGNLPSAETINEKKQKTWFFKDETFDREIETNFKAILLEIGNLSLDELTNLLSFTSDKADPVTPKQVAKRYLATIILLDQFPRNIFRNDKRMYDFDTLAINIAKDGIEKGLDKLLFPIERLFFYMPFMHSEEIAMQERSLELFHQLFLDAPESLKDQFSMNEKYAISHYDIVKKFNRFPHRNQILKRDTTDEEAKFLQTPGSSF